MTEAEIDARHGRSDCCKNGATDLRHADGEGWLIKTGFKDSVMYAIGDVKFCPYCGVKLGDPK
jgi:hypothetical protein